MTRPRISVIIVSDYVPAGAKDWADERACAAAFARQDLAEPCEIVVVASHADVAGAAPPLPGARLLLLPSRRSTELRDQALAHTRGELVAVIEADCLPADDWLRLTVAALERSPACQAVSGRTVYDQGGSLMRLRALLDRGYVETGQAGPARHVCSNGALHRRGFLQRFPFPADPNPFVATWRRNQAILAAGERIEVEPAAILRHAYGGPGFERDLRRNVGFRDALDWGRGGGPGAVLRVWRQRNRLERADLRRLGRQRLRWWDWPLVPGLMLSRRLAELPGIRAGLRGEPLKETGYR